MTAYLGMLGRLIPIHSTPSMSVSGMPARTYETTLEGRVQAQIAQVGRREWSLTAEGSTSTDAGRLWAFVLGEWGLGPFTWVSPTALAINLLTPDVSTCGESADVGATTSLAGPLTLPDGVAGRSLFNTDTVQNMYFGPATVPVLPGEPITVSAYIVGAGARMGVNFHDAAGTYISNALGPVGGVAGSAKRLSVTATPPANAASCAPFGGSATYGARPAVTWTSQLIDWGHGQGCAKAIVDTAEQSFTVTTSSNVTFTIKELG